MPGSRRPWLNTPRSVRMVNDTSPRSTATVDLVRLHAGCLVEVVRHVLGSLAGVSYQIRTYGDPVLTAKAAPVADIDGKVARLVDDMFDTLYNSNNGLALAAPQIGVQKQIFVYDLDDEPTVVINPEIVESSGEWVYEEGCLSIPGLYVEMVRPKQVLLRGFDVDGNTVEFEADELEARMYQHELDHLNGVLMFDRMTPEQRREAMARVPPHPGAAARAPAPTPPAAPALSRPVAVRLVYLGTPEVAVPPLAGPRRRRPRRRPRRHPPDRRRGRGGARRRAR